MGQPIVSVIIPAFNSADWIRDTIQSALNQDYLPVEVIVVDDSSKDNTWALLQEFKDSIRAYRNTENAGISATRNRGIQEARGDFIALLDHDDLWAPDKITKQMRLFGANPALGLVFSDCHCVTSEGKRWRYFQERPAKRGQVFQQLLQDNFIPCPSAVIPKKILNALGSFREDFRCGEEYELFLRIAKTHPIDYVDEPLVTYKIHGRNYSSRILNNLERIALLEMYSQEAPSEGEVAVRRFLLTGAYLKQGSPSQAAVQLLKALKIVVRQPSDFFKTYSTMRLEREQRLQRTS